LIQVTGAGSPNLFLMNPAGMVFGSEARLNLPGSFTATTATGIGFEGGMFNAFGSNDWSNLRLAPTSFSFATATGMILNEGQLSVPYGQNLWLVGGSVLNLGTIAAPGGNITLAAIPEERSIRLHQEGMILDLVLEGTSITPEQLSSGLNLFQPTDIPTALTSGTITHSDQLTVSADGRVFLGSNPSNSVLFNPGDVGIAGRVQAGEVQLMAAGQVTPTDPSWVQTPGKSPTVVHFAENLTDPLSYTFIDQRSDQALDLLYGGHSGTIATIVLKSQDGIGEVTQALQEFARLGHQLDGIQIVAEGNQGYIWLGNDLVDSETLAAATDQLQQWRSALGDGADLLIYSCFTALGLEGEAFVQEWASSTGLDVAASLDATSSTEFGGNWDLEYQTGTIELQNPFTPETLATWNGKLATIIVTNTNDSGANSLRNAFQLATNGDTITFDLGLSGQTIGLGSGQINWVVNDLILDGDLDNNLTPDVTVSGSNINQIFNITAANATINGVRLINGNTLTGNGGAIQNTGSLTISNSVLDGNSAIRGGGLANSGTVTLTNSTIANNTANQVGGGIVNLGTGTITITGSTLSGNQANGGGGLENYGIATITNSTISGNSVINDGGGIWTSGTLSITNSTIANNSAPASQGGGLTLFNGTVNTSNSIFADNVGGDIAFGLFAISSDLLATGVNIVKDSSVTGVNILNVDPLLGALADNGGFTQTHALLTSSPAIDASTTGTATDQRGITRPQGSSYDIGAFEVATNLIVDNLMDEDDNNLSVGNTSLREILTRTSLTAVTFNDTSLPTNGTAVINLSSSLGELLINRDFTLDATSLGGLILDGGGANRIFNIDDGSVGIESNVILRGVTLRNGFSSGNGGAIFNQENLTIENSTIVGNSAQNGGGIYSPGSLTIVSTQVSNNTATGNGSGIFSTSSSPLVIDSSSFTNNNVYSDGGGGISLASSTPITVSGDVTIQAASGNITGNNVTINANGNLSLLSDAGNISLDGASITNSGTGTGNGNLTLTAAGQLSLYSGTTSQLQTSTGSINLSGLNDGIYLGATSLTSTTGNITLTGTNNTNTFFGHGIDARSATITTSGSGAVSLSGSVGSSASTSTGGIYWGGTLETQDGEITLDGSNSTIGSGSDRRGVQVINGTIQSTGSGAINITGDGGSGTGSSTGVSVQNTATIETTDGDLSITGTAIAASTGSANTGITNGGTLRTTGTGNINLNGTSYSSGTYFNTGVVSSGTIAAQGSGNITITGTGSTNSTRRWF